MSKRQKTVRCFKLDFHIRKAVKKKANQDKISITSVERNILVTALKLQPEISQISKPKVEDIDALIFKTIKGMTKNVGQSQAQIRRELLADFFRIKY